MFPQTQPRKKRNSSRVNLAISFSLHLLLIGAILYFAAREGFLGKKIQTITVQMIKEKPPEKPKPPEQPQPPPPKIAEPARVASKPPETVKPTAAPPPPPAPVAAPPSAELPAFQFSGGHVVDTESDPVQLYKNYMEYVLREKWNRPDNLKDAAYVAEVQVRVDKTGDLQPLAWLKSSGNPRWDDSIKQVFQKITNIGRPPPTNFPPEVTIRFDTVEQTEAVFQ